VRGAQLGLLARRESALHTLVASLPNASRHLVYPVDVNDHGALRGAAQNFLRRADGIDIVIANAGISYGTLTERPEDLAVFETILQTNLMATVATFAPFIDAMKTQAAAGDRGMRLVGIGSVAGIRGLPGAEAYSASKAAVMSYCESLRVELNPHRIRVVTIAPGYIDTPMTKVNRYPMPFLMPAPRFARLAADVIRSGRSYAVIPWQMRGVSWLLRLLPNWLYDRVMAKAPHKTSLKDHPHSDVTAG
jgi:NAD(P)-dependent dehydrogenase (short-subunit alcohol dehydrogenase family)